MATCNFIKEAKQTAGSMGGVMRYVSQEKKTLDKMSNRYLTGVNCVAELAYPTFMATKNLYKKANGTFFYHYVQSFSPQETVTPREAHSIALELAERFFPDCEVLVATHIDAEHLHSHFVVNSVKPDTGQKVHFTPQTLLQMREVSDQICMEHGLSLLQPYKQKEQSKGLKAGEYRAAVRGQSWKFQLITTIEAVMERVGSREEFIQEMHKRGYAVRWEDGRRSITYTTPSGMKCRDDKLHESKFRKELMEYEFGIRRRAAQQYTGQAEAEDAPNAKPDGSAAEHSLHYADADAGSLGEYPAGHAGPAGEDRNDDGGAGYERESQAAGNEGRFEKLDGGTGGTESGDHPVSQTGSLADGEPAGTGWERERLVFEETLQCGRHLSIQWGEDAKGIPAEHPLDDLGFGGSVDAGQHPVVGAAEIAGEVVHLLSRLEDHSTQVVDSTTRPVHTGRRHKKLGIGQREDDHELEQKMT